MTKKKEIYTNTTLYSTIEITQKKVRKNLTFSTNWLYIHIYILVISLRTFVTIFNFFFQNIFYYYIVKVFKNKVSQFLYNKKN